MSPLQLHKAIKRHSRKSIKYNKKKKEGRQLSNEVMKWSERHRRKSIANQNAIKLKFLFRLGQSRAHRRLTVKCFYLPAAERSCNALLIIISELEASFFMRRAKDIKVIWREVISWRAVIARQLIKLMNLLPKKMIEKLASNDRQQQILTTELEHISLL